MGTEFKQVAWYCTNNQIFLPEPIFVLTTFYESLMIILNMISFLLLLMTALLYCFTPEVQDVEGNCTFHYTLNLALLHGTLIDLFLNQTSSSLDFCITECRHFYWSQANLYSREVQKVMRIIFYREIEIPKVVTLYVQW